MLGNSLAIFRHDKANTLEIGRGQEITIGRGQAKEELVAIIFGVEGEVRLSFCWNTVLQAIFPKAKVETGSFQYRWIFPEPGGYIEFQVRSQPAKSLRRLWKRASAAAPYAINSNMCWQPLFTLRLLVFDNKLFVEQESGPAACSSSVDFK